MAGREMEGEWDHFFKHLLPHTHTHSTTSSTPAPGLHLGVLLDGALTLRLPENVAGALQPPEVAGTELAQQLVKQVLAGQHRKQLVAGDIAGMRAASRREDLLKVGAVVLGVCGRTGQGGERKKKGRQL